MVELNDLLGYNLKIYQSKSNLKYTIDSVLLAEFVKIKTKANKILEIGSGTGAISLILSKKTNINIDAVEIQPELYSLFSKTIKYNKLDSRINLYNEDINNSQLLKNNYYDNIVCNPPYYKESKTIINKEKFIARHDVNLSIEQVAKISKKILKNGGSLSIVYTSSRLDEIINIFINNNLIPKRIKFIYDNLNKNSDIVLLELIKNGNNGLIVEPPFILNNLDGTKTREYNILLETKEE